MDQFLIKRFISKLLLPFQSDSNIIANVCIYRNIIYYPRFRFSKDRKPNKVNSNIMFVRSNYKKILGKVRVCYTVVTRIIR